MLIGLEYGCYRLGMLFLSIGRDVMPVDFWSVVPVEV